MSKRQLRVWASNIAKCTIRPCMHVMHARKKDVEFKSPSLLDLNEQSSWRRPRATKPPYIMERFTCTKREQTLKKVSCKKDFEECSCDDVVEATDPKYFIFSISLHRHQRLPHVLCPCKKRCWRMHAAPCSYCAGLRIREWDHLFSAIQCNAQHIITIIHTVILT